MLSLAFTLTPFLYFGVRSLADRAAFMRLVPLGLATAACLAAVLLPPLVNDWFMFAAKAGQDAVTLDTLERSSLMIAGTGYVSVGIAVAALAAYGWWRWWKRDRLLAGYVLTVVTTGAARDRDRRARTGSSTPLVFARYLVPGRSRCCCLLAAEGLVAILPRRGERGARMARGGDRHRARGGRSVARAMADAQPVHRVTSASSSTTTMRTTPTSRSVGARACRAFYRELARAPAGSLTIVVAPWRLESHLQSARVVPGGASAEREDRHADASVRRRDFGEYPEGERGMRLANVAHVESAHARREGRRGLSRRPPASRGRRRRARMSRGPTSRSACRRSSGRSARPCIATKRSSRSPSNRV